MEVVRGQASKVYRWCVEHKTIVLSVLVSIIVAFIATAVIIICVSLLSDPLDSLSEKTVRISNVEDTGFWSHSYDEDIYTVRLSSVVGNGTTTDSTVFYLWKLTDQSAAPEGSVVCAFQRKHGSLNRALTYVENGDITDIQTTPSNWLVDTTQMFAVTKASENNVYTISPLSDPDRFVGVNLDLTPETEDTNPYLFTISPIDDTCYWEFDLVS